MSRALEDGQERNVGFAEGLAEGEARRLREQERADKAEIERDLLRGIVVESMRDDKPKRHLKAV